MRPDDRASPTETAGIEHAARRQRRSPAAILDPDALARRDDDAAGTRERRQPNQGTSLDLAVTIGVIHATALRRRCLSYGDLAWAHGMSWAQARFRMDPHLFALCRHAAERDWPLLSAIVVDGPSVAHGRMRGRPLIGFVRCAQRCGRVTGADAGAFLAAEQARVFDWASREPAP